MFTVFMCTVSNPCLIETIKNMCRLFTVFVCPRGPLLYRTVLPLGTIFLPLFSPTARFVTKGLSGDLPRPSLEPPRALSGALSGGPFFYSCSLPLHVLLPKCLSEDLPETLSGASPCPLRSTVFLSFFSPTARFLTKRLLRGPRGDPLWSFPGSSPEDRFFIVFL